MSSDVITAYFDAWNSRDLPAMLDCVTEDFEHRLNQGGVRRGRTVFGTFLRHIARCYDERLSEIVVMSGPPGRYAAEFMVTGRYLETDDGLPEAAGQTYRMPGGTFFELTGSKIARATICYNMADWMRQISPPERRTFSRLNISPFGTI